MTRSEESCPTGLVAERPPEGSRGLQPTVPSGRGPRRGATLEHHMKLGRSLSRRSATGFPSGSIRGLKSTATVTLSLRENPLEKRGQNQTCALPAPSPALTLHSETLLFSLC